MTKDWGTRPHDSAVQITSGGVLVKTGAIVKLYSTDSPKAASCRSRWTLRQLFHKRVGEREDYRHQPLLEKGAQLDQSY